jgi:hypothetical protein
MIQILTNMPLYKKHINLLKFTDTISDFSQRSKEFVFPPNCQEMLGAKMVQIEANMPLYKNP